MATIDNKFIPIEAIHPTEIIKDELKARGMQKKELAERLGMKAPNLSRFLSTKEAITPSMALKLEKALGIQADYWIGMQMEYERDVEEIRQRDEEEVKAIQVEKALSASFNLTMLFKRLSIDGYKFFRDKLAALYEAFNVGNAEELIALSTAQSQGCFKKSDRLCTEERNLSTWILLARYECYKKITQLPNYEKGNETKAALEIAEAANSQSISEKEIMSILWKNGIGYCVVEKFDKTPVDAYSVLIDGNPFIVTSHRRNNMDMLVFDILHECGHISKHLADGMSFVSYNQNLSDAEGVEQEANNYAKNILIPPQTWSQIMKGKSKSLNAYSLIKTVTEEAKKNGISPTIAAWRFKYETGIYKIPGYKSLPIR